jgi:hypothetical protein
VIIIWVHNNFNFWILWIINTSREQSWAGVHVRLRPALWIFMHRQYRYKRPVLITSFVQYLLYRTLVQIGRHFEECRLLGCYAVWFL